MKKISISPPNSLITIASEPTEVAVEELGPDTIPANDTSIMVPCLCEIDGETAITLAEATALGRRDVPRQECVLKTPNRMLKVFLVPWDEVLSIDVPTERTRVRIWTNEAREPDEVIIGVGE